MEVVERLCDHVAIMSDGVVRMHGPLGQVRGDRSLEEVFVQVVGGRVATGSELAWL
jgi:ABC-2 type transport system ATP-binding protein